MSSPDFKDHLRRQLAFMQRSCAAFDEGVHEEAIRIATIIRVLMHDTKKSTSLLKHLNATTINPLSTSSPTSPDTVASMSMGTVCISSDGDHSYFPSLGDGVFKELVPVSKWWNQEIMIVEQVRLTRRKIVLAAANQDGGAHVDAKLDADYNELKQAGFAGTVFYSNPVGETETPLEGSHFVCLRQMAYELLNSPELLSKAIG